SVISVVKKAACIVSPVRVFPLNPQSPFYRREHIEAAIFDHGLHRFHGWNPFAWFPLLGSSSVCLLCNLTVVSGDEEYDPRQRRVRRLQTLQKSSSARETMMPAGPRICPNLTRPGAAVMFKKPGTPRRRCADAHRP